MQLWPLPAQVLTTALFIVEIQNQEPVLEMNRGRRKLVLLEI
jgi:hypothetical protein